MKSNDFDKKIQKIFNRSFGSKKKFAWKEWLEINSIEEYEEYAFKLSGINNKEEFNKYIDTTLTNSRDFSIDKERYVLSHTGPEPLILCHTSGTTDGRISKLKWFHMNEDLIKRIWIPGMSAIFESSGLNQETSAVIFVPSRIAMDGIKKIEDKQYMSLYSSEFSQRLAISIINPKDYIFQEYKESKNLEVLFKIISMENVSIISAPAATILGWADIEKLKAGILKHLNKNEDKLAEKTNFLDDIISDKGINRGSRKIQELLSDKLSHARLVFSISNLTKDQWDLISKFMRWTDGKKRFTNLYVGSEIGPFACSLTNDIANNNQMHVFPLTIPVIENKGKRELMSKTNLKLGNLLISYSVNSKKRINIDTGDVISVEKLEGLPIIGGTILRNKFKLKYPIKISPKIEHIPEYNIFVGHYFPFKDFEIKDPKTLIECLKNNANLRSDSLLLISSNNTSNKYELILSTNNEKRTNRVQLLKTKLLKCNLGGNINKAIQNGTLELKLVKDPPIDYMETREEMLSRVRDGCIPKGVLKKWPLYVLESSD